MTSNYIQAFAVLSQPFAAIAYPVYLAIWGLVGLLAAGLYFSNKPGVSHVTHAQFNN